MVLELCSQANIISINEVNAVVGVVNDVTKAEAHRCEEKPDMLVNVGLDDGV